MPDHKGAIKSDAEMLAMRFHYLYEKLAPNFRYETRPESAKPWDEVPEDNRCLMIAVCDLILDEWGVVRS